MGPHLINSLKAEETFFSTFKAEPKAFKAFGNDLRKLKCFFIHFSNCLGHPFVTNIRLLWPEWAFYVVKFATSLSQDHQQMLFLTFPVYCWSAPKPQLLKVLAWIPWQWACRFFMWNKYHVKDTKLTVKLSAVQSPVSVSCHVLCDISLR